MTNYELANLTWPEVEELIKKDHVTIIPVGSCEQHGHHTPFATDTESSYRIACQVADRAQSKGLSVIIVPSLSYGLSWYHMDFPGTITLSFQTFINTVFEVSGCLLTHGFKNIILLNSHGGNRSALSVAQEMFMEKYNAWLYQVNWGDLVTDLFKDFQSPLIHAEEVETSVVMALGIRVEMERATRDAFDRRQALKEIGQPTSRYLRYDAHHTGPFGMAPMSPIRQISKSGVVGDATKANLHTGQRILEKVVERLVELCEDLAYSK